MHVPKISPWKRLEPRRSSESLFGKNSLGAEAPVTWDGSGLLGIIRGYLHPGLPNVFSQSSLASSGCSNETANCDDGDVKASARNIRTTFQNKIRSSKLPDTIKQQWQTVSQLKRGDPKREEFVKRVDESDIKTICNDSYFPKFVSTKSGGKSDLAGRKDKWRSYQSVVNDNGKELVDEAIRKALRHGKCRGRLSTGRTGRYC